MVTLHTTLIKAGIREKHLHPPTNLVAQPTLLITPPLNNTQLINKTIRNHNHTSLRNKLRMVLLLTPRLLMALLRNSSPTALLKPLTLPLSVGSNIKIPMGEKHPHRLNNTPGQAMGKVDHPQDTAHLNLNHNNSKTFNLPNLAVITAVAQMHSHMSQCQAIPTTAIKDLHLHSTVHLRGDTGSRGGDAEIST